MRLQITKSKNDNDGTVKVRAKKHPSEMEVLELVDFMMRGAK